MYRATASRNATSIPLVIPGHIEQLLERGDVDPTRGVGAPAEGPGGDLEIAVRVGEPSTEGVQEVPEIGAGLRLGRGRPQQERQVLPRRGRMPVQHQEREQRLGAGRLQRRHPHATEAEIELAEDLDPRDRLHPNSLTVNGATVTPLTAMPDELRIVERCVVTTT